MLGAALFVACCLLAPGLARAAPANDDFAAALVGGGDHLEGSGNNFGATKQAGEPDHDGDPGGASVWFGWTAPRSQLVYVTTCSSGWRAQTGIYRGDSVAALQPVAAGHVPGDSSSCGRLSFRAISTVTYRIAIDGTTDAGAPEEGNFSFEISSTALELPLNDEFAAASPLQSKPEQWIWGSTDSATREPGEPGHGGDPAGASVWYRWTAPETRPMRLFPCQAGFHPTLAVYAGSTLGSLRPVGYPAPLDSRAAAECQLGGSGGVGFEASAGTTYSFVVDGEDGGWGEFQLRLLPLLAPYVDVYPPDTYIYDLLRLRRRGVAVKFGDGGASPGDTFLCKLDGRSFAVCGSPVKWHGLAPGRHRVAVVATDAAGNRDQTPAVRYFQIRGKAGRR